MSTTGRTVTMTYDGFGRKLTEADSTGSTAWTYDVVGNILAFTDNNLGKTVSYTYNTLGQKTQMAVEGFTVDYRYDRLGRLAEVQKHDETHPTVYTYDTAGRRASLTLPNGVRTDYAYNPAGNLVDLLTTKPGTEEDDPRITLARFMYTVDATGNRTAIDQNLNGTIHHLAYTFDNAYRLTGETRTEAGGGLLYQEQFTYDALGNRLTQLKNGVTTARTYNNANQLITEVTNPEQPGEVTKTYSYDANGNNIGWSSVDANDDPVASQTMTYDWLNRMTNWSDGTKSESTIYRGTEWKRITTVANAGTDTTTTHYLYDEDNVVADYVPVTAGEETILALDRFYVTPMLDQNLSMTLASGTNAGVYYYSQDGLGSVRTLMTSAAAISNTYDHSAFGEAFAATTSETISQRYQYTGREKTTDPAILYYRWRMYGNGMGRFDRRDPAGYQNNKYGNLYDYVYSSPAIYNDPYGLVMTGASEHGTLGYSWSAPIVNTKTTYALKTIMESHDFFFRCECIDPWGRNNKYWQLITTDLPHWTLNMKYYVALAIPELKIWNSKKYSGKTRDEWAQVKAEEFRGLWQSFYNAQYAKIKKDEATHFTTEAKCNAHWLKLRKTLTDEYDISTIAKDIEF